jgi:hypothetical protein
MNRRIMLGGLGLIAAGFFVLVGNFLTADDQKTDGKHAAHFDQCAKACADCMRECESCANHCAHLMAAGKQDHLRSLGSCADCAEVCAAAAKIVARHGPLANTICESCAKACDTCAAACEKHPNDDHMKQCAKACRDCAQACQDMLKHLEHGKSK